MTLPKRKVSTAPNTPQRTEKRTRSSSSCDSDSASQELVWKWSGRPIRFRGTQYYDAVTNSYGEVFSVGDCVSILIASPTKQTCCAVIESLFSGPNKEMMLECRWFEAPRDIPRYRKEYRPRHDREVFETNHVDECEVESIVRKVRVVQYAKFNSLLQSYRKLCEEVVTKQQPNKHSDGPITDDLDDPETIPDEEGFAFRDTYLCEQFYSFQIRVIRPVRHRQKGFYSKRLQAYHSKRGDREQLVSKPIPLPESDNEHDLIINSEEKFSRACHHLQLSSVPQSLPCREAEREQVQQFLRSAILRGGVGSTLYISGMPGTGKTATVLEVVRALEDEMENDQLPPFHFVEINGMKLPHPYQAYTHLYRELTGRTVSHSHAAQLLEKRFSGHSSSAASAKRNVTVVLVDELDYMVTRKQTVVYNLFDWPTRPNSKLVVIGIANTMDLPERLLPRIHSRLGMGRVVFQPYSRDQIVTIIKARIEVLKVFKPEAVGMCARKVASCSGDIRRALQICRRAAEICVQSFISKWTEAKKNDDGSITNLAEPLVTIRNINTASSELQQCIQTKAIKCAPLLDKLVLIAIYRHVIATGTELIEFEDIWNRFSSICRSKAFSRMPKKHELVVVCRRLGASKLLILEEQNNERTPKVRLGVEVDDIKFAYSDDIECYSLLS